MTVRTRGAVVDSEDDGIDSAQLIRIATWAGVTLLTVAVAVIAARSDSGGERLVSFIRAPAPEAQPAPQLVRSPEMDLETRRLTEAVRMLTADRDRLIARIDALERSTDVTGSILREPAAARAAPVAAVQAAPVPAPQAAPPAQPAPQATAPALAVPPPTPVQTTTILPGPMGAVVPPAPPMPLSPVAQQRPSPGAAARTAAAPPQQAAVESNAAESVASKTEFGVDLGGDTSMEGLRLLWGALKANNAGLLEGLRPLVTIREGAKPGTVELRLVAGPLGNAGAAVRLCAAIANAGVGCQPSVFDGQRLALK